MYIKHPLLTIGLKMENNRPATHRAIFNIRLIAPREIEHGFSGLAAIGALIVFSLKHRGLQSDLCV
jgi:hypothetical protein